MTFRPIPMLVALSAPALVCSAAAFAQQAPAPEYGIKTDAPIGSNIRRYAIKTTGVPINRRYDELSAEQKAVVASWYERINPGDEPPFPADGLKPIHDAVRQGQQKYLVRGELLLFASVGPSGDVDSVKIFNSPDPKMTKFVSTVLMLTKFKPAMCAGSACRMEYPFTFTFTVE